MRILNNEYLFFGFNWIQLDSIRFNWMQLRNYISYSKFCIEQYLQCTEKANIIFKLKGRDMLHTISTND